MKKLLPLLLLLLAACSPHPMRVVAHTEQQYTISKEGAADSVITALIRPYKRGVDTQMQVVIGYTDIPLTKAQPESTLGNFVADATLEAAKRIDPKTVAAVSNYGGIRLSFIAAGPITRGKVYELMPFDNMLTIVELPGNVLQQLCDKMAASKGWPVSGLTFTIKDKAAIDVMVGGQPLNNALFYKIALSDYVARGGDNCDFLKPMKKRATVVFIRDAMLNYVTALETAGKPLHPTLDNRIRYAE